MNKRTIVFLATFIVVFPLSGFAQVIVNLYPDISPGEIQTNRNAQTATPGTGGSGLVVTGSILAASILTATRLRIVYPGPITSQPAALSPATSGPFVGQLSNCIDNDGNARPCPNTTAGIPANDPMRIEGASGVFVDVNELRLNTSLSRIEVTLPGTGGAVNINSGSFRIVGVRIDANGKTGAQSITASLNSVANNYLLATTTATIINSLGPGIGVFAIGSRSGQPDQGTATIRTNSSGISVPDATGSFILTEGFATAFRTALQSANSFLGVSNGTQIRLTFNGVPAGVTLNLATNTAASLNATLSNTAITAAANTTTVSFAATSTSLVETLEVDYTVVTNPDAAVGFPGAITATATFVPIGAGVDGSGLPREDQGYPSFAQSDFGPVTAVQIEVETSKRRSQVTSW